ncbi:hypothetical protein ABTD73_21180, partial [Acinetobacter baumannii]
TFLPSTAFPGQANSTRAVSGHSGLTIDGNPVGTFTLAPASATAHTGQTVTYTFSWTVPKPGQWRNLRNVDLQLRDAKSSA